MKLAGKITMLVGGIVFVGALAGLKYADFGNGSQTLWQLTTRGPVIVTVLAVAVCALAIASLLSDAFLLPFIGTCVSFYLWGQVFLDGSSSYAGLKAGYWVPAVATLGMSVGGFVAVIGQWRADKRAAAVATTPPQPRAFAPPPPPPPPVATPAGWYADPSGQAQERYWSGNAWTEESRGEARRTPVTAQTDGTVS